MKALQRTQIYLKLMAFLVITFLGTNTELVAQQQNSQGVKWSTSYMIASQSAQQRGVPVLLFFEGTQTDAITQSLLYNTFFQSSVYNLVNNSFIPVRIQGDKNLERLFNVIRYPTIVIANGETGQEIDRISGIMSTENLLDFLNNSMGRESSESTRQTQDTVRDGSVAKIVYRGGSFLYLGEGKWLHKTPFYTVEYQTLNEDGRYYFLTNSTRKVFIALPKQESPESSIWTWEDNNWRDIGPVQFQRGSIGEISQQNSQENSSFSKFSSNQEPSFGNDAQSDSYDFSAGGDPFEE